MDTMLIQVTNQKAIGLLHELEELNLIKVLKENISPVKTKLSSKYRGVLSKAKGQDLDQHVKHIRDEWKDI